MSLTLAANGVTVTVTDNIREDAIGDGTDEKTIEKQLKKFGGTVFECENFEIKEFVGGFYPVSKLNMLRRNALEELKNKIYEKNKANRSHKANLPSFFEKTYEKDTRPVIRIEGKNADTMYFDEVKRIEIPLINETVWKSERLSGYISKISLILPGFIFDGNVNDIKERLEIAKNYGIKSVTIPNITFIPLCGGFEIHADYMTNCISSNTARVIKSHKISSLCASPEAKSVGFSDGFDEKIVYGRVVLMNTRTCIIKNITDCTENEGFILTDRTNALFPIFCSYLHSNLIYNSVPIWLFDKKTDESLSPVLIFTDEDEKRQREIFKKYIEKSSPDIEKFTRAEY